jgi:hypothetical protein
MSDRASGTDPTGTHRLTGRPGRVSGFAETEVRTCRSVDCPPITPGDELPTDEPPHAGDQQQHRDRLDGQAQDVVGWYIRNPPSSAVIESRTVPTTPRARAAARRYAGDRMLDPGVSRSPPGLRPAANDLSGQDAEAMALRQPHDVGHAGRIIPVSNTVKGRLAIAARSGAKTSPRCAHALSASHASMPPPKGQARRHSAIVLDHAITGATTERRSFRKRRQVSESEFCVASLRGSALLNAEVFGRPEPRFRGSYSPGAAMGRLAARPATMRMGSLPSMTTTPTRV